MFVKKTFVNTALVLQVSTIISFYQLRPTYFWGSWKNPSFRGGVHENSIYRGDCLKRGELGKFEDLRGCLARKREGVVFLRGEGVDTPMHTMIYL